MAISEAQENKMAAAIAAKKRQDPNMPFLIHRTDGRLMPNTPLMRKHKSLVPYTGSVKASLEERMRYLATGSSRRVTLAPPQEEEVFDIGTATKEEILDFALAEYGQQLNEKAPVHILRGQLNKLVQAMSGGSAQPVPDGAGLVEKGQANALRVPTMDDLG